MQHALWAGILRRIVMRTNAEGAALVGAESQRERTMFYSLIFFLLSPPPPPSDFEL